MKRHSHLRRWGAVYIMAALFLASLVAQFITAIIDVGNDAREHGAEFTMSDFWPRFLSAVFENWQSEWLQLVFQAVILLGLKHQLFKADAEDMEKVERDLDAIKRHLGVTEYEVEAQG